MDLDAEGQYLLLSTAHMHDPHVLVEITKYPLPSSYIIMLLKSDGLSDFVKNIGAALDIGLLDLNDDDTRATVSY